MSVWQQMQKERLSEPCVALAPGSFKEANGYWHLIFIDPGAEGNLDREAQRRACVVNLKCP